MDSAGLLLDQTSGLSVSSVPAVLLPLQVRYKEDFEKMKGQSLFVPGAELIHARNISAVISEVGPPADVHPP